jgi:hypothetical protein
VIAIRTKASDPKNYSSYISTSGQPVPTKFLEDVKNHMQKKYSRPGELIEMRLNNKQDIKIVGFKCNEVKIETSKIIDKAKTYNFPDTWENIIELLVSDQQCFLKDIQ